MSFATTLLTGRAHLFFPFCSFRCTNLLLSFMSIAQHWRLGTGNSKNKSFGATGFFCTTLAVHSLQGKNSWKFRYYNIFASAHREGEDGRKDRRSGLILGRRWQVIIGAANWLQIILRVGVGCILNLRGKTKTGGQQDKTRCWLGHSLLSLRTAYQRSTSGKIRRFLRAAPVLDGALGFPGS